MSFSRTFNAWKFITPDKVIIKLPLHTLKPQELMLTKVDTCIQGTLGAQIILEFSRSPLHQHQHKGPVFSKPSDEGLRTEYSDKSDPIWR